MVEDCLRLVDGIVGIWWLMELVREQARELARIGG
jgi:hypothetical protein